MDMTVTSTAALALAALSIYRTENMEYLSAAALLALSWGQTKAVEPRAAST
jgi:hypothetical protein